MQHLVGRSADPAFLEELRACAGAYSDAMQCDIVRAYHFGPRYLVELEMVMDAGTPLKVSHDPVCKSNLQPDFNVRVFECFDASSSALRELDERDRFVQNSAESTSIRPSESISKCGRDVPNQRSISTQARA